MDLSYLLLLCCRMLLQVGFYDEKLRPYSKVARKSKPPRQEAS
jgi:hypothetical protein